MKKNQFLKYSYISIFKIDFHTSSDIVFLWISIFNKSFIRVLKFWEARL